MYIFKTKSDLKAFLKKKKEVGFVPTMGALHDGHLALIARSKSENMFTGCSIFINPTQFNNQTDFDKYPITVEKDIELLLQAKCDFLFLPSVNEMYPEGTHIKKEYALGRLDSILEGKFRPGHFNGVCEIVQKLLEAVMPEKLYMGEKDFQQCMVIKKLLELTSLPVNMVICPTQRDKDGLAKSSRNLRLSAEARAKANTIYDCLLYIKENQNNFSFQDLQNECLKKLSENGFNTEYLELANSENLELLRDFDSGKKMVVLIASVLDGIRLIDSMRI